MTTGTTQQTAPLASLKLDNSNVRKTGRGTEPQYVATIRERGIIIPLVVRPNGDGFKVTDGGKRRDSLLWMAEHGESAKGVPVTGDYPVPIVVFEGDDRTAKEISLITAIARMPVHPVDQYEAFAELAAEPSNMSPDDIARVFGVTRRQVDQSMALGALSPKIRKAWREGLIPTESAQTFTLARKHKDQDKIFDKLMNDGRFRYGAGQHEIRSEIVGNQGDAYKFVNFVGKEAYEAAGGELMEDLFHDRHAVSDPALAKKLADEKLTAKCQELIADGWSWAKIESEITDPWRYQESNKKPKFTDEEIKRIKELDAIIEAVTESDGPDDDEAQEKLDAAEAEKERIEHDAQGRAFKPKDKAAAGCIVGLEQGGLTIHYGMTPPKDVQQLATAGSLDAPDRSAAKETKTKTPATLSNALKQRLRTQMLKSTKAALLADKHAGDLAPLLAKIVASQINTNGNWNQVPTEIERSLVAIRNAITPKVMNEASRKEFDAKDYFSSVPKSFNIKAITEAVNADEARKVAGKTKAEIAKFALANVGKTKWLPPELRAANYDGPTGKKAAKK